MRRKVEHGSHPGLERWLLTYADMITLLMAFFIMMYSMSVLNLAKFRQAAISIRSGFGGMMKGQARSVLGSSGRLAAEPSVVEGDTAGVKWRILKPLVDYIEGNETGAWEGASGVSAPKGVTIGEDKRGIVMTRAARSLRMTRCPCWKG